MNTSLESTRVEEVMTKAVFTVGPNEKITDVATKLRQRSVNAAPVVDKSNVCIGIITSHDLLEYESVRIKVMDHLDRGLGFDLGHYSDGHNFPLLRVPIDQVGIQMTAMLETVAPQASLSDAARLMCQKHIHHLVVLDESKHPIGMLSSLDILAHATGETICVVKHNS